MNSKGWSKDKSHVELPPRPANPRMEVKPILEVLSGDEFFPCMTCKERNQDVRLKVGSVRREGETEWSDYKQLPMCSSCLMTLVGKVDLWLLQEGLSRQVANEAGIQTDSETGHAYLPISARKNPGFETGGC